MAANTWWEASSHRTPNRLPTQTTAHKERTPIIWIALMSSLCNESPNLPLLYPYVLYRCLLWPITRRCVNISALRAQSSGLRLFSMQNTSIPHTGLSTFFLQTASINLLRAVATKAQCCRTCTKIYIKYPKVEFDQKLSFFQWQTALRVPWKSW